MKNSLMIILFFALGLGVGFFNLNPPDILNEKLSLYALFTLMFLVGVGLGIHRDTCTLLRSVNMRIIAVPLVIVAGTLLGAGSVAMLLPEISLRGSLAIGAGFGYYSLSSVLITGVSGEVMGVTALLANIIREIITLLLTPLLAQYCGKLAPIASGGATSMDTTLPVITRFSGKEYAIIAVFSGTVLTILVPFLLAIILNF